MTQLELVLGDLTEQDVDAIVNAANAALAGGGGVDGAIHHRGGPEIMAECRRLGGCPPGDAKATTGGRLAARYVVHAVGPRWRGGGHDEEAVLASAYRRSLEVAAALGVRSVAFPSISTGIYGFPIERAAPIALRTVRSTAVEHPVVELVRFVLFSPGDLAVYQDALAQLGPGATAS
jgi:O-acetyl-ADP-ribose deacetylase (regulator of RNase III)